MTLNSQSPPAEAKASPIIPDQELPPLKSERSDFFWAASLALMALLPAVPFLLHHETILGTVGAVSSENLNEWMIYRGFLNDCISRGLFPAWTPQLLSGMPFIGWPHTSAFAPLGVIYYLLPYNTAAVVGLFVHAMIFAVSMYILMRFLSFRPFAAWCAAVMAINFFIVSQNEHYLPRLFSFSWSPLLLAFYAGIWRTRRFRYLLGAAAVLALQLAGGNIEIIVRQFLALATAGISLFLLQPREIRTRWREIILIGAAAVLGNFPVWCQSLPALEFVHGSIRSDPQLFTYALYSASAKLTVLLIPSYGGIVLCAVTLAAAVLCALELRHSLLGRVLALAALANILIAFNAFGVLKIFYHLPVLGSMMWHSLSILFVSMMAIILCGKAIDHALRRPRPRHLVILSLALLIFAIINLAEAAIPDAGARANSLNNIAAGRFAPALLALAALGFAVWLFKLRGPAWGAGILVAAVIMSCYGPSFMVLHHEPDSFPDWNPAYVKFFARQTPPARSFTVVPNDLLNRPSIPYQVGFVPGTEAIDAFISSPDDRYAEFYQLLVKNVRPQAYQAGSPTILWEEKTEYFIVPKNLHLLDLLNLVYISADGVNINLASHYFLGYRLDPSACTGRPCRSLEPQEKYGHPGIALTVPSQWKQAIFAPPQSELHLTLQARAAGPGPGSPLFFLAAAAPPEGGKRIIYARALDSGSAPPSRAANAALAPVKGQSMDLVLSSVPIAGPPAPSAAALDLIDPFIYNPHAVLQRVALPGVDIFQNRSALPRAFVTHRHRVISDKPERLAYLGGDRFDPSAEVVLEREPMPGWRDSGHDIKEPVKILEYKPGHVVLFADLAEDGFMVISDAYSPGWTATVGGREERILRADHAFQAVPLGRGPHQVTLTYWPASLRIGIFASLAGLLTLALTVLTKLMVPSIRPARGGT